MHRLTPAQCRAARALLRWSQADLANKSGIARRTIAYFESGRHSLALRSRRALGNAFMKAGIVFDAQGGIRRDPPGGAAPQLVVQGQPTRSASAANSETERDDAAVAALEKAKRWRMRAEEYWAVSEQMRTPRARETYAHLARSYERLAEQFETRAQAGMGKSAPERKDQTR